MGQQLAIIGDFTRGNEVIELLEMLGGVNGKINKNTGKAYNIYNGNYFISEIGRVREVAYYIDFTSQIRCIDIKDITGHFIVYSLEVFLEQYPFKIGDKVILDNKLCSIIWMCWECNNIYYQVQGIDDIFTKKVTANELKPYKKTNMKYKVGDKVRIKSLDWYNENKDEDGIVELSTHIFTPGMSQFCGKVVTIEDVFEDIDDNVVYYIEEIDYDWTDEMIDCLVERNEKTYPYKIGDRVVLKGNNRYATITDLKYNSWGNLSYYIKIDNDKDICIDYPTELLLPYDNMIERLSEEIERENEDKIFSEGYDQGYEDGQHDMNEWVLPEGFQFKDENGNVINTQKIVLEKKDNDYPKTYEECVEILGRSADVTYGYKKYVLHTLQMLLVCRDAYWQIAGQEMGLDDPWEPDYKNPDIDLYVIINIYNQVEKAKYGYGFQHCVLAFPTEKMRETFYENFKEEIDKCKELL